MKKVVKISEKKLINFIKKSLNEYNNKMINKTNNVLNEQDNNGWKIVPSQDFFNNLKNTGKYEFKTGVSPKTLGKDTEVFVNKTISGQGLKTFYKKKSEEKVELTPEQKKEDSRQKDIEEAWQEVQLYGQDYDLYMEAELDSNGNKTNYYDINGIKYYNDGFKVIGKKKVRYFKEDENFRNPPYIKIVWDKVYPCVPNYAIKNQKGDYDKNTNIWTIENVIYKPIGKKSLDNGKSWVDFNCFDSELKNYIERKK